MIDPRLFADLTGHVLPEWIDLNGHMNLAYYLLAFDKGTDALFARHDIGWDYTQRAHCGLFVLETHLTYEQELREGEPYRIASHILGVDAKRLHFFHYMHHAETGVLAATNDSIGVHVDLSTRRSTPWPDVAMASLTAMAAAHAAVPRPPQAGRAIGMDRKRAA